MKKRLSLIFAAILIFATFALAMGGVSADESVGSDFLDAVMADVTMDGMPMEYVLDKQIEGRAIGAAWSMTAKNVYLMVMDSTSKPYVIDIGGKTLKVDGSGATGIDGASSKKNGMFTEIAIPIEKLNLGYNGAYGTVALKFTVEGEKSPMFDGRVIFTDYYMGMAYNAIQEMGDPKGARTPEHGAQKNTHSSTVTDPTLLNVTKQSGYKYVMYDADTETAMSTRLYVVTGGKSFEDNKDQHFECDLNIVSMPYSNPFVDGVATFDKIEEARIWFLMKYGTSEMVYVNIINTADGLLLLVQQNGREPDIIELGKSTGETFTLALDLSKLGILRVRVDGKTVGASVYAKQSGGAIGQSKGVFSFNVARNSDLGVGGEIKVELSNISAGLINTSYILKDLLALSATPVDTSKVDDVAEETTTAEPEYVLSGVNVISKDGYVYETAGSAVNTADAETSDTGDNGGCGSVISGWGTVAVIGAVATVASTHRKKREE